MLGARCDNDFEKPVRKGRKKEKEKNQKASAHYKCNENETNILLLLSFMSPSRPLLVPVSGRISQPTSTFRTLLT